MNRNRLPTTGGSRRRSEDGFTFIELIISVVLLTMITGAISVAFVTSINSSGATNARVHASNDAQVIAAFLIRDAQAAGGVDPTNPLVTGDPTLGVSLTDPAGCGTGSPTFRFAWRDWVTATVSHLHVVNYFYVSGTKQLTRTTCTDGVQTTPFTIGNNITSVAPSCIRAVACPGIPDSVSVTITETNNATAYPLSPYTYTLQATVRTQGQAAPTGGSTASLPTLLALGGSCGTPGVTAAGNNTKVTVAGPTVINGQTNPPTSPCQLLSTQGGATFTSTPAAVYPPNGLPDPYLNFPPPNDPSGQPFNEQADCLGGPNPSPTTVSGVVHYLPGVYQDPTGLSVTKDATFDPGVYFFCNGLSISGTAHVTATAVLFYFAQGALAIQSANTQVTMSGLTSGPDAGFVIWMPRTDTTTALNLSGQTTINQFKGLIYVPNVDVTLGGGAGVQLGSIIAHTITFSGGGQTIIGNPPSIIGPATLPDWTIGNDYGSASRPATMTTTGGTAPYTWSATGLPPGLTINPSTGVIGGTPSATGTFSSIVVTVTDAQNLTATKSYSVTINPVPSITGPTALPTSTQGVAYPSTTMTASGGTAPLSWFASGLPAGMSINTSTGAIGGTPTASGTFTATVTVADVVGVTATRDYPLTINSPPTIGTTALPDWTVNKANYNATVSASSGTPPYTWSATGLPAGLTINASTGVISGTPTRAGTSSVTVTITDSVGARATRSYSLTINGPTSITGPASLPASTVNRSYPGVAVTATGGTNPYAWSATGLQAGLNINAGSGVISGTPTASGTSSVTVTMTDAAGATATRIYSLTINVAPSITTGSLPNGEQGLAYSATVSAANGTTPYSWAASGLPAGLTINANSGLISGTPTATGSFSVSVTVTDTAGATATRVYPVTIGTGPAISGPATLPAWTVNRAYPNTTVTATGGTTPYVWSATGLPAGLSINAGSGVISGTPTAAGTFSVVVKVTDAGGATATQPYTLTISTGPVVSTPATLPAWTVGRVYPNTTVTATGGTTPYAWSTTGLPAGLSINAGSGVISGTPTAVGTASVTVTVTDSVGATGTKAYSLTIKPAPSITGPAALPSWTVNRPYPNTTVTATGGTTPYAWSATGLPAGLSMNAGTGAISGTPTATGTASVTVTLTDAAGATVTRVYSVTINAAPSITGPATLPNGTKNASYNATVSATGGTTPYTWSATGLPNALSIANTGVISGTPHATGSFSVTVTVTDAAGASATRSYTLTIN